MGCGSLGLGEGGKQPGDLERDWMRRVDHAGFLGQLGSRMRFRVGVVGGGPEGSPQGPILNVWASHVHQAWVLRLDFMTLQEGAGPPRSLSCPHPQFCRLCTSALLWGGGRCRFIWFSGGSLAPEEKKHGVHLSYSVSVLHQPLTP